MGRSGVRDQRAHHRAADTQDPALAVLFFRLLRTLENYLRKNKFGIAVTTEILSGSFTSYFISRPTRSNEDGAPSMDAV